MFNISSALSSSFPWLLSFILACYDWKIKSCPSPIPSRRHWTEFLHVLTGLSKKGFLISHLKQRNI